MKAHRTGSLALIGMLVALGSVQAQEAQPPLKPSPAAPPPARRAAKTVPRPAPVPTPTPNPTPEPKPVDPRPQVAVMAFDYGTIQSQWWGTYDIGAGIADQIVDSLVNEGSFRVIERKKLDTLLAEQDFAQSDRAAPDAARLAKLGKVAGVRYIVTGSITQFHTSDRRFGGGVGGQVAKSMLGPIGGLSFRKVKHEVKLTARLIDTTTGEVLLSATGDGRSNKGQGASVDMSGAGSADGVGFSMTSEDYRSSGIAEAQEKATAAVVQAILQKRLAIADGAPRLKSPVAAR
jgi:curli biogenesis system outer membrane secretion channel CsgG